MKSLILAATLCLVCCPLTRADVVTFNRLADSAERPTATYTESGMTVVSRSSDPTRWWLKGNGFLQLDEFGYYPYEFTYAGGGAFTPLTFDVVGASAGVMFQGYRGEALAATLTYTGYPFPAPGDLKVAPGAVVLFGADFRHITRLVWTFAPRYSWFTAEIDNLRFEPAETPVPEPATLILLGTGLAIGALKFSRRRGRK